MEPTVMDGKLLAKSIRIELKKRASALAVRTGKIPMLATIMAGNNPDSLMYIEMKAKNCAAVGIESKKIFLPEDANTQSVIEIIRSLNSDPLVTGILLQHPTPPQIDVQACFDAIAKEKDADGVTSASFGAMSFKREAFVSATALGIMKLLAHYRIETAGRHAVVLGRSPILGKPAAMLLLNADATVTVCHTKTKNLPEMVKQADILVAAVGRPRFVQAQWLKPGVVLVDAGYNEGAGDADLDNCIPLCSAYTPVPGGVGPMTRVTLIGQTIEAAEKLFNEN
ncbi:MAG: bifunctional 5,10-methylene-tetrahydrofolate dehydrogenase/5,10-methylene-tetrahydrofolate cyclohydrolase [Defluviitaleaceae bacterium]|nr:bifunctional 5,10-methylene-tetrahydrofolate dehydrogenase/5,10-methylene-tetrahydrofolate cyclohydrolase [Defluviitaleaceae bacterium]